MVSIKGISDYVSSFTVVQKASQSFDSLKCWKKKEKEELTEVDLEAQKQYEAAHQAMELHSAGKTDEAFEILHAEVDKNNSYALSQRATLYLAQGDHTDALADAMDLLALGPQSGGRRATALFVAGKIFLMQDEPFRALQYFSEAHYNAPKWPMILEGITRAQLDLGEPDKALKAAAKLLHLGKANSSIEYVDIAWKLKGMAYLAKGNTEKALFCFEKMSDERKAALISDTLSSVK